MNEKQAKLLRYFIKYSGDKKLAELTKKSWPFMPNRARGKIARWMKKVVVTMMHVKSIQEKAKAQAELEQKIKNMAVLKGFS